MATKVIRSIRMIIRQEETTPIGNHFHDAGILKQFNAIENIVDEFEVDTEELTAYCDSLIDSLRSLKSLIKKAEAEWEKKSHLQMIKDLTNPYN